MSAEGKKKRGEAGQAHAKANPFRINGWAPDWAARRQNVYASPAARSGGATSMRGMLGGFLAAKLGFTIGGHEARYEPMLEHAEKRVTSPAYNF